LCSLRNLLQFVSPQEAELQGFGTLPYKTPNPISAQSPTSQSMRGTEEEPATEMVETAEIVREKIKLAAQHYLGQSKDDIMDALRSTMEGHQRQILGTLTVEDLYMNRAAFSSRVKEHGESHFFFIDNSNSLSLLPQLLKT
jgi:hypothetical protein